MPNNYILLETIALTQSAASVTFDNLPTSGYTDLVIKASTRATGSRSDDAMLIRLNSDSTIANYSIKWLRGNGSSATSGDGAGYTGGYLGEFNGGTSTSNTFTSQEIYIPNYRSSNAKSFSSDMTEEANQSLVYAHLAAGLWTGTAAITNITFVDHNSNSFAAGSTFSLYGIAAFGTTPVLAPKATGGNIVANDGTYWYHAFTSSGNFVPQTALTADCLVIAGGGAGSGAWGAGGGAGGLVNTNAQSLLQNTFYAVIIGSGASYVSQTTVQGSNSNITGGSLSLTAAVGGGGAGTRVGAQRTGGNGGSGGGAVGFYGASTNAGGVATIGQGNNGGSSGVSFGGHAGGGGAGAAGGNVNSNQPTAGGVGSSAYSAWGLATSTGQNSSGTYYFAGGGGGGGFQNPQTNGGAGGLGGGGAGGNGSSGGAAQSGTAGLANTGGGGGGGGQGASDGIGANGGSGIVIIRYPVN